MRKSLKKVFCTFMTTVLLLTAIPWQQASAEATVRVSGDVNGDLNVTLRDATLAQKIQLDLVPNVSDMQRKAADMNGNGTVETAEETFDVVCKVTVKPKNYLVNAGFEDGDKAWTIDDKGNTDGNNGVGVQADASNVKMWWHMHPNTTVNGVTLGDSFPSKADLNGQKRMVEKGYKGNSFVVGTRTGTVTFFNEKRSLITIDWDDFLRMGGQEQ